MARGSLADPFGNKDESPMKQVSGSQIGSAAGALAGTLIPIPGVGTAAGAVVGGAVGGVIGGLFDKKDEEIVGPSQAELDVERRLREFEDFQFRTNNPYEDMTVNLQAADYEREMSAQQQADTLQALRGGRGAAGAAALATAMSRQAAEKERAIAADIGRQEQEIQKLEAEQEAKNFLAAQQFELDRMQTMLGIDMAQVTGEEQGRLMQEQGRLDRQTQLIGAGLTTLGNIAGSAIAASD